MVQLDPTVKTRFRPNDCTFRLKNQRPIDPILKKADSKIISTKS